MSHLPELEAQINALWESESMPETAPIERTLELLDRGELRVAEKIDGAWRTHQWIKKAVLLYFRVHDNVRMVSGPLEWFDKVPLKSGWETAGVRAVPTAVARWGAFVERGAVLMPCYVNVGARIGSGTMIDTWSTVGSCAQVGRNCHISGGVGIGGVLEPLQANPVIVEDDVFIGARSEVAEGVLVRQGAVLAMGSFVGASTRIYNELNGEVVPPGVIPPRAVCVPGALPSPKGDCSTYALIIKKFRDQRTDARTALNSLLREGAPAS